MHSDISRLCKFLDSTERIYQFLCIMGLVSVLGQCSNGLRQIMHELKVSALSHP